MANKSKHIIASLILVISSITPFILFEIARGLGSLFTFGERMLLVLFSILFFVFPIIIRVINRLELLFNMKKLHDDDKSYCPITGEKHCCIDDFGMELIKSGNGIVEITKNKFLNDYKLILESKMNELEKNFSEKLIEHPQREIWIFSYNLKTEVLSDNSQKIAVENVNKGIKYVYFHTNNDNEQKKIEDNKHILYSYINEDKRNTHIKFIPLEDNNIIGLDIFDHLVGSIIFISPSEDNLIKSYFSLRGNLGNNRPIYYKLPSCMNSKYYKYFEERKQQYENNKSN